MSISSFKEVFLGMRVFWLILALLLLAEATLRMRYFGINALLSPSDYVPRQIIRTPFVIPDNDLVYRLKPGSSGYFKGREFTVNRWGWRGKSVTLEKAPNTFRIALLGASITMGSGVSDDETFGHQLELILSAELGRRVEVINMAVGGYKGYQILRQFEIYGSRFNPDLVIFSTPIRNMKNENVRSREITWDQPFPFPLFLMLLDNSFLTVALFESYHDTRKMYSLDENWEKRDIEETQDGYSVDEMIRELAANQNDVGTPVILNIFRPINLLHPSRRYARKHRFRVAARQLVRETDNLYLIDASGDFNQDLTHDDRIYPGDHHPNAAIHRQYAEQISRQLIPLLGESGW